MNAAGLARITKIFVNPGATVSASAGHIVLLFSFVVHRDGGNACRVYLRPNLDGAATDLTVLDVFLLGNRAIYKQLDGLAAIGAVGLYVLLQIHLRPPR